MLIAELIADTVRKLELVGVITARLDTLVLLEDTIKRDRAWILAHPEHSLQGSTLQKLEEQIARRAKHEPLAYIRGKSEFYGREFMVTADTLQPRAETETMIDLLSKIPDLRSGVPEKKTIIIDVGTGSGCLAITAALEVGRWRLDAGKAKIQVYATDISAKALKIAEQNAKNLKANVTFLHGNLLQPLSEIRDLKSEIFVLLANLPYVPTNYPVNKAATHEPAIALFGGDDGLDLYREMFKQISDQGSVISEKPEYIFTESLLTQHAELAQIAKKNGYIQTAEQDLIQFFEAT
jgi:release factor glutamine methyltransferase